MLRTVDKILQVLLLSLLPTFEGRYALLYGIAVGLSPVLSLAVASVGVVLLSTVLSTAFGFIDRILLRLSSTASFLKFVGRLYTKYILSARRRAKPYVDRYGVLGLTIFVAIPLPATGVWTGALAAYVLGFSRRRTLLSLVLGGMISNIITFAMALLGLNMLA